MGEPKTKTWVIKNLTAISYNSKFLMLKGASLINFLCLGYLQVI